MAQQRDYQSWKCQKSNEDGGQEMNSRATSVEFIGSVLKVGFEIRCKEPWLIHRFLASETW